MTKQKQKEKTLSLDLLTRVAPIFVNVFIIAKERRKSIIFMVRKLKNLI